MSEKRDYYDVLGLDRSASESDIRSAYKKMAKKYHPDLNPDDPTAEDKFKEVAEAYEVLSDSDKKRNYDQFGHAGVDPSYGGGGGAGYSGFGGGFNINIEDIFGDFFGGGGRSATRDPNAPVKGGNVRVSLTLEFMEAVHGVTKKIQYSRLETCEECKGSGAEPGTTPETCTQCHGSGMVDVVENIPLMGQMRTRATCPTCGGKGQVIKEKCSSCGGEGRKTQVTTLNLKVPGGIDNGQALVRRGKGDHGINGGPAGDLIVSINVLDDPIFKRDGYDIWVDVPLTYRQLVVGDEVIIPTVDGKVSYTVKEGTQPGTVVRLRGKGVSYTEGKGKGDQYLNIQVEVPRGLNSKQKQSLEDFDDMLTERNYAKRKRFFDRWKNK